MRFSIWQKPALFLILILLVVIIFRIAKSQSYINSTVYEKTYFESYIGQSPGGGLKYSDIFQNKPIRISIYKKEFDIDVRWSNSNEILIEN